MLAFNVLASFQTMAQTQWAPSLTSHDPNPPMTLEDPTAPPSGERTTRNTRPDCLGLLNGTGFMMSL